MKREKIKTQIKGDCHFQPTYVGFTMTVAFVLVFLFSFLFVSLASAEVATFKKALIWSGDDSSEYKLPEISGSVYSVQDFVATDGQITSLAINWQASGKINFEVSADSGLHYYAVTNGVPLKNGFVSGNRLRWRAQTLSDDAKLSLVKISYTDSSGVAGDFGEPALSGFLYRKAITLKSSPTQDLYNYQLKLKIGENESVKNVDVNLGGEGLADFKDIRFSAADGQEPLAYYRESVEGEAGSRIATFWVKVPQIPKDGVIFYLYYGLAGAEDLSDPNATFDFYEDFTATSLDKNKWVTHTEQKGSATLTDGGIKLDAAEIISKSFQFKEGIIEYSCLIESGFENSLNIRKQNEESYDSPIWLAYSSIYKGAEHCIAVDGIVKVNDVSAKLTIVGEKYNYRTILDSGKLIFERFGMGDRYDGDIGTKAQASVSYNIDPMPKAGYLSLRSGGDGAGKNVIYFGAIRARKAASILPVIGNIGKEERIDLPVFVNTKLTRSGSISLKDTATSGYYLARDIASTDEAVRIIIPSWKLEPADKTTISVSVSADRGVTYKKDCENARFYYASKKDFSQGSTLKLRFDLSGPESKSDSHLFRGISRFSLDYRPGKINIISPNGKEQWGVGEKQKISWSALDYEPVYPFDLAYSTDKGKTYIDIITNQGNDGAYLWAIPDKISKTVKVKVSDTLDKDIYDTSDALFSIVASAPGEEEAKKEEEAALEETTKPEEKAISGAQLLLINDKTRHKGKNNIGDVVAVFDSDHEFSPAEKAGFTILRIPGATKEQVEKSLAGKLGGGALSAAKPEASSHPKYKFRVTNPKEANIDKMCITNERLK